MRPSWICNPFRSYLGDTIYHTADARYNQAIQWYRTLLNLGFQKSEQIIRLARFIRYGVLSASEASLVFYGRLPECQKMRFELMIYWIDESWIPEEHFYFKFIDWSWLDMESPAVSTALFP